jgi:hypothetical protein
MRHSPKWHNELMGRELDIETDIESYKQQVLSRAEKVSNQFKGFISVMEKGN